MLGLGADREILRGDFQCRLRLAGAHAARPRHSRRLRPAQERHRKAQRPRAAGAARHGDDGLMFVGRLVLRLFLVPLGCCFAICIAVLFVMVAQWTRMAALTAADDDSGLMMFVAMVP